MPSCPPQATRSWTLADGTSSIAPVPDVVALSSSRELPPPPRRMLRPTRPRDPTASDPRRPAIAIALLSLRARRALFRPSVRVPEPVGAPSDRAPARHRSRPRGTAGPSGFTLDPAVASPLAPYIPPHRPSRRGPRRAVAVGVAAGCTPRRGERGRARDGFATPLQRVPYSSSRGLIGSGGVPGVDRRVARRRLTGSSDWGGVDGSSVRMRTACVSAVRGLSSVFVMPQGSSKRVRRGASWSRGARLTCATVAAVSLRDGASHRLASGNEYAIRGELSASSSIRRWNAVQGISAYCDLRSCHAGLGVQREVENAGRNQDTPRELSI
jgi:hypothetical protein